MSGNIRHIDAEICDGRWKLTMKTGAKQVADHLV